MTKAIHQEIGFSAPPAKIYKALTEDTAFATFTGAPAEIDTRPGGALSLFGGKITGRNVELMHDKRVVQAWRAGNWPDGLYSLVTFELAQEAAGTKLTLTQIGHPGDMHDHLIAGWGQMYWTPLKAYAAKSEW